MLWTLLIGCATGAFICLYISADNAALEKPLKGIAGYLRLVAIVAALFLLLSFGLNMLGPDHTEAAAMTMAQIESMIESVNRLTAPVISNAAALSGAGALLLFVGALISGAAPFLEAGRNLGKATKPVALLSVALGLLGSVSFFSPTVASDATGRISARLVGAAESGLRSYADIYRAAVDEAETILLEETQALMTAGCAEAGVEPECGFSSFTSETLPEVVAANNEYGEVWRTVADSSSDRYINSFSSPREQPPEIAAVIERSAHGSFTRPTMFVGAEGRNTSTIELDLSQLRPVEAVAANGALTEQQQVRRAALGEIISVMAGHAAGAVAGATVPEGAPLLFSSLQSKLTSESAKGLIVRMAQSLVRARIADPNAPPEAVRAEATDMARQFLGRPDMANLIEQTPQAARQLRAYRDRVEPMRLRARRNFEAAVQRAILSDRGSDFAFFRSELVRRSAEFTDSLPRPSNGYAVISREWRAERERVAADFVRESRMPDARDWEHAFASYLRGHPEVAAAWGFLVISELRGETRYRRYMEESARNLVAEAEPALLQAPSRIIEMYIEDVSNPSVRRAASVDLEALPRGEQQRLARLVMETAYLDHGPRPRHGYRYYVDQVFGTESANSSAQATAFVESESFKRGVDLYCPG